MYYISGVDYMIELFPKKEQKKYEIIELLFYSHQPLTVKTISKYISSSTRSVHAYLSEIKFLVEKINGKLITSSKGIQIHLPLNIGIDYFQQNHFQTSLGFQLLELLFQNRSLSEEEIEDLLFISSSSINRIAKKLAALLKPYGLFFSTNPFSISGDEFLIRKFYTTYFFEAYAESSWPHKLVNRTEIEEIILNLPILEDYVLETMNYSKFCHFMATGYIREKLGYSIANSEIMRQRIDRMNIKSLKEQYTKKGIILDIEQEKIELYATIISYYYDYYNSFQSKRSPDLTEKLYQTLEHIRVLFELPETNHTYLLTTLNEFLFLNSYLPIQYPNYSYLVFKPRDYSLIEIYQRLYPLFYKNLECEIKKIHAERNLTFNQRIKNSWIYEFLSKWDSLSMHMYDLYNKCKIIVYSPLSNQHAENIQTMLIARLERACVISAYKEPFISTERLSNYDFDLLVTTTTLNLDIKQPIVIMPRNGSGYSFASLGRQIDKVIQRKKIFKKKLINSSLEYKSN